VTPYLPEKELRRTFAPVQRYLSERLDRPIRLVITNSYEQMTDALLAGRVDVADLPPFPFLLARRRDPTLRPLAMAKSSQTSAYRSYLVTRRRQDRKLSDLRGRRVCYVDRTSTSGFLMPRAMVRDAGFDPDRFFSSVQFSGDHQRALRDLLAGRCDVAAVWSDAYAAEPADLVRKTHIVAISRPLPQGSICASPELSGALARQLRDALLAFDVQREAGRATLSKAHPVAGFVRPDLEAFDRLGREAAEVLKPVVVGRSPASDVRGPVFALAPGSGEAPSP
jgi:phosphonate transport system substrate-binding protein